MLSPMIDGPGHPASQRQQLVSGLCFCRVYAKGKLPTGSRFAESRSKGAIFDRPAISGRCVLRRSWLACPHVFFLREGGWIRRRMQRSGCLRRSREAAPKLFVVLRREIRR